MVAAGGQTEILAKRFYVVYGNNVLSAQLLEVSLLLIGVGAVLRPERDAR